MERATITDQLVQLKRKVEGRPLVVWPIEDEKEAGAVIREFEAMYGQEEGLLVLVKDYSQRPREPVFIELSATPGHIGKLLEDGRPLRKGLERKIK